MRQSEVNDTPRKWLPPCDNTSLENSGWKSWTNVCMSPGIIYGPLQLCKYQCWATFLTANDGLGFGIIMTDQHWIIHPRALKYAITLQLLRIHPSWHSAIGLEKAVQHNSTVINCYGPSCFAVVVVVVCSGSGRQRSIDNRKTTRRENIPSYEISPSLKSWVFWPLTSAQQSQGGNTFQNTINPSRNKEKSFPAEISWPGFLMSHYSVNRKSHLPQFSEKAPMMSVLLLSVMNPKLIFQDAKIPRPFGVDMIESRASWWVSV